MVQLNEFLADVPLHTDYTVFDAQLAVTKANCEQILGDAKKDLDSLLANVKGAETLSQIFSHDPVNLSTGNFIYDRTERNGAKTTYVHDEKFRDIRHTDSEGTESFEYNKRNQKTLFMDKLGRKTQYGYNEKGNLTRVINALGIKTEIRYGEGDSPVSICIDGREKIHYAYNEAGEIEETRDALGNLHCLLTKRSERNVS